MEHDYPHLLIYGLSLWTYLTALLWFSQCRVCRYLPIESARLNFWVKVVGTGLSLLTLKLLHIDWTALKLNLNPALAIVALISGLALPEVIVLWRHWRNEATNKPAEPVASMADLAKLAAAMTPKPTIAPVRYMDRTPRPTPPKEVNLLAEFHRLAVELNGRTQTVGLTARNRQQKIQAILKGNARDN